MDERLKTLLDDLARADRLSPAELRRSERRAAWFAEFASAQVAEFLEALDDEGRPLNGIAERLLTQWLRELPKRRRTGTKDTSVQTTAGLDLPAELIAGAYKRLGPTSRARTELLVWLAWGERSEELEAFGRMLVEDPPQEEDDTSRALAPLFQHSRTRAAALFPQLLTALAHPQLAAPVLDLANFLKRQGLVAAHPAQVRTPELAALLGQMVQSLLQLEENPDQHGDSAQALARRVAQSVGLVVSLCDALALCGDTTAIGKLHQALTVRHRRVRTEAAAALARLGDDDGRQQLLQLAAEPVARLRVLAYAQELGLAEQVDAEFKTPVARAEAELSAWLAEPVQFGLPPTTCELVDQRRQYWPGFQEPVDCFLFRFQYVLSLGDGRQRSFSNIGIAGPLTHAFVADLADLPAGDIYAAFAGWQAEHDEIREFDVSRLSKSEQLEVERLKRKLHDAGFLDIEPQQMGYFFGDKALIALAQREGAPGVAVADFESIAFFPRRPVRPLGSDEAYCIYKGRKLLATFNR